MEKFTIFLSHLIYFISNFKTKYLVDAKFCKHDKYGPFMPTD